MGVPEIAVILVMLLANSVFAAFELALASVSLGRLKLLAEQKRRGAAAALAMKDRMEASLAVVQIGITLVGAIAAATGGAGAEESIAPWLQSTLGVSSLQSEALAIALVVFPLAAVTIVVGELVPKSVAMRHSEWVCLQLGPAMRVLALIAYPAVVALEGATKGLVRCLERGLGPAGQTPYELGLAELQAQARALRASRIIGPAQERIIMGTSTLSRATAADVMVEAEDIVMLNAHASVAEHIVAVHLDGYTRFPVTETPGDPQGITGYVNIKDIFFLAQSSPEDPTIRRIVRPLTEVRPEASLGQVFSQMMREHVHLVAVKDAEGVLHGMITLEDILEEIVGDIQDEFDRLPRRIESAGNGWVVGGGATLGQLAATMGNPPALAGTDPAQTFADWIGSQTDRRLKGGDVVRAGGFHALVRKVHRKRVMEALVTLQPEPPATV